MFSTILAPLDGSDTAAAAIPVALDLAKRFDGRLIFVQVIETTAASFGLIANAASGGMTDPNTITGEMEAQVETAKAYLSATSEQAARDGVRADYEVRDGDAASGIIAAAEAASADLIVICSHGRGGLGRLVFGSVTDHVVQHATTPVLVVRAPHAR